MTCCATSAAAAAAAITATAAAAVITAAAAAAAAHLVVHGDQADLGDLRVQTQVHHSVVHYYHITATVV